MDIRVRYPAWADIEYMKIYKIEYIWLYLKRKMDNKNSCIWPHIVSLKYLSYLSCDLSYPLLYFFCVIMVSRYIYKCPLLPDSRLFTWAGYPANIISDSYSILANMLSTNWNFLYTRKTIKNVTYKCIFFIYYWKM